MSVLRLLYAFMIVFIFVASTFVSPILASSGQETASSVVTIAENAIVSAYEAVLDAERVGADVSGLLGRLNEAGEFFAAARMSYENGDFEDATLFADLSRNVGEEVGNEAYELEGWAQNDSFQRTWLTILASVSGIVFVGLGSLWVWRFLKRRYQ